MSDVDTDEYPKRKRKQREAKAQSGNSLNWTFAFKTENIVVNLNWQQLVAINFDGNDLCKIENESIRHEQYQF